MFIVKFTDFLFSNSYLFLFPATTRW